MVEGMLVMATNGRWELWSDSEDLGGVFSEMAGRVPGKRFRMVFANILVFFGFFNLLHDTEYVQPEGYTLQLPNIP